METALKDVEWVFEAIPVKYLRQTLEVAKPLFDKHHKWVVLSKGIEQNSLSLPGKIIDDVIGYEVRKVIVAGPSFAKDLSERQLTGVNAASHDQALIEELKLLMDNDYCKLFFSDDVRGVQVASAVKNVVTLGVGMLDGAEYLDNTKTLFIMQSIKEIERLVVALGGKKETVYDLAGIGDIILTACGKSSRNLMVGKKLGAGESLELIMSEMNIVPEGVNTVTSVMQIIEKKNLHLPLLRSIATSIDNTSVECLLDTLIDL